MKVSDRIGDSFTRLEKSQMESIKRLQEKIELLEFDKSKDKATIRELKCLLNNLKRSINEITKEIEQIQKEGNYIRLNYIRKVLGIIARQGVEDE